MPLAQTYPKQLSRSPSSAHHSDDKKSDPFATEFPWISFNLHKNYELIGSSTLESARPILKVYDDKSGRYYAVKMFLKSNLLDRGWKAIEQTNEEARILRKLSHPFIPEFIASWQSANKLYIAMEYMPGGEVFDLWKVILYCSCSLLRFYAAQAALALDYLHASKIIYRDLKMENMLLDAQGYLKLIDFGASKQMQNSKTYTICGTLAYAAPEMLNGEGYDYMVDWWALGIFAYAFTCGDYPVRPTNDHKDMRRQVNQYDLEVPQGTEPTLVNFIMQLLRKNPHRRLSGCSNIKKLDFFRGQIDFLALQQKVYDAKAFFTESDISHLPDGPLKQWALGSRPYLGTSPPPQKIPTRDTTKTLSSERYSDRLSDHNPYRDQQSILRRQSASKLRLGGSQLNLASGSMKRDDSHIHIERSRDPTSSNQISRNSNGDAAMSEYRQVHFRQPLRDIPAADYRPGHMNAPSATTPRYVAVKDSWPFGRNPILRTGMLPSHATVFNPANRPVMYLPDRSPGLNRRNSNRFVRTKDPPMRQIRDPHFMRSSVLDLSYINAPPPVHHPPPAVPPVRVYIMRPR